MNRKSVVLGISSLVVVIILLLSSPTGFFAPSVTFIDTELFRSSGSESPVRTITDFGSPKIMAAFPREIGKWTGTDYDVTDYVRSLGADVVLLRLYDPSTFSQPLFLTIVQAKSESAFHPPKVCLTAQGYRIQEEGTETIPVTGATWAIDGTARTISMGKLAVTRNAKDGTIVERRLVLFFYVKGNRFNSDTITMVQVEGLVPIQGPYDGTLGEAKALVSQAVPLMFEPGGDKGWRPLVRVLADMGIGGYVIIGLLCAVPAAMITYNSAGRRKKPAA